jgi:hypothetical protein
MRISLLALLIGTTAWADVSAPSAIAHWRDIHLPGWKGAVHLGMSIDEVRRAAGVALEAESGTGWCTAQQCLSHDERRSATDPIDYWILLEFDRKGSLEKMSFGCNGTEGCSAHPLSDFWKAETGSATRDHLVARGMSWKRNAYCDDDSGDAWEEFEISAAVKRR